MRAQVRVLGLQFRPARPDQCETQADVNSRAAFHVSLFLDYRQNGSGWLHRQQEVEAGLHVSREVLEASLEKYLVKIFVQARDILRLLSRVLRGPHLHHQHRPQAVMVPGLSQLLWCQPEIHLRPMMLL